MAKGRRSRTLMQYDIDNIVDLAKRNNVNLDITHRCPLACERCQRFTSFTSKGLKVPGKDMTLEEFDKVMRFFTHLNFCGQVSDPVHHPKFIEILAKIREFNELRPRAVKPKSSSVHHASAAKPMKWYPKAFDANPDTRWWFGIDGFPKDSHKYRTNQDGEKLFEIMKLARKHLKRKPYWQYIVFSFNENDIDACHQMAKDIDVDFMVVNSSRWLSGADPLRPTIEHALDLNE